MTVVARATMATTSRMRDRQPGHRDLDRRIGRGRRLGDGDERQHDPCDEQAEQAPGDEADPGQDRVLQREPARELTGREAEGAQQGELGDPLPGRYGGAHDEPDDREERRGHEPDGEGTDDAERDRIGREGAFATIDGEDGPAGDRALLERADGGGPVGFGDGEPPLGRGIDGIVALEPDQGQGGQVHDERRRRRRLRSGTRRLRRPARRSAGHRRSPAAPCRRPIGNSPRGTPCWRWRGSGRPR